MSFKAPFLNYIFSCDVKNSPNKLHIFITVTDGRIKSKYSWSIFITFVVCIVENMNCFFLCCYNFNLFLEPRPKLIREPRKFYFENCICLEKMFKILMF